MLLAPIEHTGRKSRIGGTHDPHGTVAAADLGPHGRVFIIRAADEPQCTHHSASSLAVSTDAPGIVRLISPRADAASISCTLSGSTASITQVMLA